MSPRGLRWLGVAAALSVAGSAARAQSPDDVEPPQSEGREEAAALKEVLQHAHVVVRGRAGQPTPGATAETARFRYTPFRVSEVLKGTTPEPVLSIREPVDGPEALTNRSDLIVLLSEADADEGFYQLEQGLVGNHYEVVSGRTGEWVPVNAAGVDAQAVLSKDKHHHAENHEMPLEDFRQIARATDSNAVVPAPVKPGPDAGAVAPATPVAVPAVASEPPTPRLPANENIEAHSVPWASMLIGVALFVLLAVAIRRLKKR